MSAVVDIDWVVLGLFFATLLIPFALSRYYQLQIGKELFVSVSRMTAQLALVGIYLEYLFKINSCLLYTSPSPRD